MPIVTSWRPKKRNVTYQGCPEGIPEWVYTEAQTAKYQYNENWEFWVYRTSQEYNCSQAKAEDACIRGIKQVLLRMRFVYGDKIGKWYEDYLEMGDIFDKVRHPEYLPKLSGD